MTDRTPFINGEIIRANFPIEGVDDDVANKITKFYKDLVPFTDLDTLPNDNITNRDFLLRNMMDSIQIAVIMYLNMHSPYNIKNFILFLERLQKNNGLHPIFIFGYVDFCFCANDAIIRSDWAEALKNVKKGSELSYRISYRLTYQDLSELAKLHKANRFRKKIEGLLEDINLQVCSDFQCKNYKYYIFSIFGIPWWEVACKKS